MHPARAQAQLANKGAMAYDRDIPEICAIPVMTALTLLAWPRPD